VKTLLKIFVRYVGSAVGVALILVALNLAVLIGWFLQPWKIQPTSADYGEIAGSLVQQNGRYVLSDSGQALIQAQFQWAMLLDDDGDVVWSENLPPELPRRYTVADVASFSRWYLNEYPVRVWRHPDGLLVLGSPPGAMWKHAIEMPEQMVGNFPAWVSGALIANSAAALVLALLFGLRLFRALKPLIKGIDDLAETRPVRLSTGGLLGDLAHKLNQTSEQLRRQAEALQKRDNARTTWIAGISHDIRTPLSMVLGYASQLESDPQVPEAQREQAGIICRQGEKIGALVSDLNLASKLEYAMQPLHTQIVYPAELARSVVADFLNNGLTEEYSIDLDVRKEAQGIAVTGDEVLLRRAISNLIDNSIQHNPDGCAIRVRVEPCYPECWITISDNGAGFPQAVLETLGNSSDPEVIQTHGLGLTIVRQIVQAHGGTLTLENLPKSACRAVIRLPMSGRDRE
jgi:signal transduction histidine kinase